MGCSLYYIKLKVGAPSQEYFLDADTGSSLTWINCKFTKTAKCQKEVSPCQQPNQQFVINTIILQFVEQFLWTYLHFRWTLELIKKKLGNLGGGVELRWTSPLWLQLESFGELLWILGVENLFHYYITKYLLIFFVAYTHIFYLVTLCSSHHLCAPQIEANARMALKSFSKFVTLK